jgi:hypothetical protein
MSSLADEIRLTFSVEGSNADPYLGDGWQNAEFGHRWTDGLRSVLRLPPLRARDWFALTLQGWALNIGGVTPAQTLTVVLNGTSLRRLQLDGGMPMTIAIPGDLVRADSENILVLDHPEAARPSELQPGHGDTRLLSLAFQRLEIEPLDEPLSLAPRLLAKAASPDGAAEQKAVAEAFQSLGQSCDVGVFQRLAGAEPFGLLRFAGIFPVQLIQGLRTRFAGVGDADKLSFFTPPNSQEFHGKHSIYGLDYHTFKMAGETDVAALAAKEAQRLNYLARLFFEQLENDEKIFLRVGDFTTPEEALALHLLLRTYHPCARLLLLQAAPAHAPERIGRVIELRPGLYRGYLSRPSDLPVSHSAQLFEEWMQLCATVVSYESARG